MDELIPITDVQMYEYARGRGFEPLLDGRFILPHALRVQVQRDTFGKGNHTANNQRFYKWMWEHKPHVCEECGAPLKHYSASSISHILSRGAHPETAYDPRNVNILCLAHHNEWENGDREGMRIFQRNEKTIETLKAEYAEF